MTLFPTSVKILEKVTTRFRQDVVALELLIHMTVLTEKPDAKGLLSEMRQDAAEIERAAAVLKDFAYPDPATPILNGNKSQNMKALLQSCIDAWPQYLDGEEISGGDMVEWFGVFRQQVISVLAEPDDAPSARGDASAVEGPEEDENPFDPESPEGRAFAAGEIDATGATIKKFTVQICATEYFEAEISATDADKAREDAMILWPEQGQGMFKSEQYDWTVSSVERADDESEGQPE